MSSSLKLYLVTENEHKYKEAYRVLIRYGIELDMLPLKKLEVQSDDLREVAWKAAIHAYRLVRKPLIVDDSGLFIKVLNGFPGVYSNYVFRTIGLKGILKLLENEEDRRACFKTALAAIVPPLDFLVEGEVCGKIAKKVRGSKGFGFDPIFVPEGSEKTFGEMDIDEKNKYSHRAKAFSLLAEQIKKKFML
jgi:XTP/dITP diphosphohydrolase